MLKNNFFHSYKLITNNYCKFMGKKLNFINKIKNNKGSVLIHSFKVNSFARV